MNAAATRPRVLSVLAVEEPEQETTAVRRAVASEGLEVAWVDAGGLDDALAIVDVTPFDAVLLDVAGDVGAALAILGRLHDEAPDLPVVALTDDRDPHAGADLLLAGADDHVVRAEVGSGVLARTFRYAVERRRLEGEIAALGLTDPTTGLRNRRGFLTVANQLLRVAARYRLSVTAVTITVERVPDASRVRHAVSTTILREFASMLRRAARSSDVIARTGAAEFTVLMLDPGAEGVEKLLRRLTLEGERGARGSKRPLRFGWVVGTADQTWGSDELLENLLDRASRAMYRRMVERDH